MIWEYFLQNFYSNFLNVCEEMTTRPIILSSLLTQNDHREQDVKL